MSTFNATIDLGDIGTSLLNFSFSACTDTHVTGSATQLKDCNWLTGCTALTSYNNTPKSSLVGGTSITLTGLTYDPLVSQIKWIHVKAVNVADGNAETATECDDSKLCQNIKISGIPAYTPTPTPTAQPTPTPTTPPTLPPTSPPTTPPTLPPTSPPTATPTNVVDPPTITPTPICYGCTSPSNLNGSYAGTGIYNYGNYCLDLTSATNGGTITINFSTAGRPNRFTIRPSVGTTISSGWWGSDYNYAGPHFGNMAGTNDNGSLSFVYNSSLTYELQVETTNANPSTNASDSWDATIICGGVVTLSPTPTPVYTTLSGVTSGTTLNDACVGGGNLTFYFSGVSIQIGETIFVDSNLTTPAPTGYYYYPDYNTIYYAVNGVLQSTPTCPTPTPTTGTVVNAVVSKVDGPTACAGGDYDSDPLTPEIDPTFFNLTIYGSNIVNASGIINIPSFLLGDFGENQVFYVRGRVTPNVYWKKFILDGSPSSGANTATADGPAVLC